MENEEKIVMIYSGDLVTIEHIKNELEANGISSFEKDPFQEGIEAGFVGGTLSTIELFILEADVAKAKEIINAIIG